MKKLLSAVLSLALLGLGGTALAAEDIVNTLHNLSSSAPVGNFYQTTSTASVCVFCHSPHTTTAAPKPLWNRGASAATYTMYNDTVSSTIDMTVEAQPVGVSLACLSCHDGTVAFDVLINGAGSGGFNPAGADQGWAWGANGDLIANTRVTHLGNDLTGDHPISITYDNVADTAFNAAVAGKVGTLPLYTNRVECGSCHNPHEADNATFLRVANAASVLCTTCHIK